MSKKIRIGTRGSKLAVAQSLEVKSRLLLANDELRDRDFEIIKITTTGDRIQDRSLADIGGKSLFTKEIEEALYDNRIDLAVHSMKDMTAFIPEGLVIASILPREDPRDALLSMGKYNNIDEIPEGALIGTSSTRRTTFLNKLRPDLKIVDFRGNLNTRIKKLEEGQVEAMLLAVAGLRRLGIEEQQYSPISVEQILPAVAQGAVAIECREGDKSTNELVKTINDEDTADCIKAERGFLEYLEADCKTPIAALAIKNNEIINLECAFAAEKNSRIFFDKASCNVREGYELGQKLAKKLKLLAT